MGTPQIKIEKHSSAYWSATFDHPPINLIDPTTIAELGALIGEIDSAPQLCVVVFRSADPDFFLAHYDVLTDRASSTSPRCRRTRSWRAPSRSISTRPRDRRRAGAWPRSLLAAFRKDRTSSCTWGCTLRKPVESVELA